MPRRLRSSTLSSFFNTKEPGSDDVPNPSNARSSTRVRKLLQGVSPLKVPTVSHKPQKPPARREKVVEKKGTEKRAAERRAVEKRALLERDVKKKSVEEEAVVTSEATRRLARLKVLPPLSPDGRRFATSVRDGSYTCADVVGEGLVRFLQDGMPGYEVFFGEDKAHEARNNIETLLRGDREEISELLNFRFEFEPVDRWSADERSKAGRYPMAIATSGVAMVIPMTQYDSPRSSPECDSPRKMRQRTKRSPETLWVKEEMGYSNDGGVEPPACLATMDIAEAKDWPQSPDYWSTESSQSSDSESEEDSSESEEDDMASEEKILRKLFPHARYRDS